MMTPTEAFAQEESVLNRISRLRILATGPMKPVVTNWPVTSGAWKPAGLIGPSADICALRAGSSLRSSPAHPDAHTKSVTGKAGHGLGVKVALETTGAWRSSVGLPSSQQDRIL